jgi:hypothetical protein
VRSPFMVFSAGVPASWQLRLAAIPEPSSNFIA